MDWDTGGTRKAVVAARAECRWAIGCSIHIPHLRRLCLFLDPESESLFWAVVSDVQNDQCLSLQECVLLLALFCVSWERCLSLKSMCAVPNLFSMRRPVASGILVDFATRGNGISVHEIFPCVLCFPVVSWQTPAYSQLGAVAICCEIAL